MASSHKYQLQVFPHFHLRPNLNNLNIVPYATTSFSCFEANLKKLYPYHKDNIEKKKDSEFKVTPDITHSY